MKKKDFDEVIKSVMEMNIIEDEKKLLAYVADAYKRLNENEPFYDGPLDAFFPPPPNILSPSQYIDYWYDIIESLNYIDAPSRNERAAVVVYLKEKTKNPKLQAKLDGALKAEKQQKGGKRQKHAKKTRRHKHKQKRRQTNKHKH